MTKDHNEWHEAMLGMFDQLGGESWPFVDASPEEAGNALYEHVNFLCDYAVGCVLYRIEQFLKSNPTKKELAKFLEAEALKVNKNSKSVPR